MPTYAYRGTACAHEFEAYQSFSEDPLTTCAECGGPVRRVIQPAPIVFKGSGWYITDSRKGSSSTATPNASAGSTSKPDASPAKEPAASTATADKAAAD
jgi:putative FmdB family regulatory protein